MCSMPIVNSTVDRKCSWAQIRAFDELHMLVSIIPNSTFLGEDPRFSKCK